MSFLEQFLKESSVGRSRDPLNSTVGSASNSVSAGNGGQRPDRVSMDSSSATATRRGMSIESDEGDVEDNRAGSITSSRSNMSEVIMYIITIFHDFFDLTHCAFRLSENFPCSRRVAYVLST